MNIEDQKSFALKLCKEEKRTALQCAARGCSGCLICDKKELHEERECFDCGKQFIPPQYESMKDSRCCEACAQFA